jgi:hypothetical protein
MKGKCELAGDYSASYINRLRKRAYEGLYRQKPHGFKLVAGCGNPQCIAYNHIRLQPWEMFRRNKRD